MAGRAALGRLFKRRQTWFLEVTVPPRARAAVGKNKVVRTLKTRDKAEAQQQRPHVFARIRGDIRATVRGHAPVTVLDEAFAIRREIKAHREHGRADEADHVAMIALDKAHEMQQHGEEAAAAAFCGVAVGEDEPIKPLSDEWLEAVKGIVKEQTRDLHKQALKELFAHFGPAATVADISQKAASTFLRETLPATSRGGNGGTRKRGRATLQRLKSSYASFWNWLIETGNAQENPWLALKVRAPKGSNKREYTPEELVKLLQGAPKHPAHPDLIRIGLFSGGRADELASLTVGDCKDGALRIKHREEGKTKAATRLVSIHPLIVPIIARRSKGKTNAEPLFPECPPMGKDKRRGKNLSQPFTRYRRSLEIADGTDFHSIRRNFATALRNAIVPKDVVDVLMGHKGAGLAFGLYAGKLERQDVLSQAVESIDYGPKVTALI